MLPTHMHSKWVQQVPSKLDSVYWHICIVSHTQNSIRCCTNQAKLTSHALAQFHCATPHVAMVISSRITVYILWQTLRVWYTSYGLYIYFYCMLHAWLAVCTYTRTWFGPCCRSWSSTRRTLMRGAWAGRVGASVDVHTQTAVTTHTS